MRPLWVLTLIFTAASLFAQPATTPDAIIAQENAFWKAYTDGNSADLSKLLPPDFINVEEQIWDRIRFSPSSSNSTRNAPLRRSNFLIPASPSLAAIPRLWCITLRRTQPAEHTRRLATQM